MWRIKSRALRDARVANMWTTEHLAKLAGVSSRTVRDYEQGDPSARLSTIEYLAKALDLEVRAIARAAGDDTPSERAASPRAPAVSPTASPAHSVGTQLPKPSRLEELVALERKHPRPKLTGTAWGDLAPLGAKLHQDIFTAFRIHEHELAYVAARVEAQRGFTPSEAEILGAQVGVGARFHLVTEIAPGHVMGLTVHTDTVAHTKRLQAALGEPVRVVVRVLVVPEAMIDAKVGLSFFFVPETLRPWGLVVEGIVEDAAVAAVKAVKGVKGVKEKRAQKRR